jgi:23S rRNA (pseudouridine1915-N3)-methyltransferase
MSHPQTTHTRFPPSNLITVFFLTLFLMRQYCVDGYLCAYTARSRISDGVESFPFTLKSFSSSSLHMAMKVNIRIVGRKSSESWLEEGVQMYETRLQPSNVDVETIWHKDDAALIRGVEMDQQKNHKVVCLDPKGQRATSEAFAQKLYDWLEEGGSRLSFVIGGAEGLPSELKYLVSSSKSSAPPIISLSALTFTHQFARLLLMEQIYRATEIRKGSGYHK